MAIAEVRNSVEEKHKRFSQKISGNGKAGHLFKGTGSCCFYSVTQDSALIRDAGQRSDQGPK